MSDFAIEAHQLSRHFGMLKAIDNLDLKMPKQEIYGFLGPNGCGKTTAIRLLTGLLRPTSGEVNVLGFSLPKEAEKLRLKMGYMTQKFSLYEDLTVKENLNFLASIYNLDARSKTKRVNELLDIYRLTTKANQLTGSMSGGQ